MKKRRNNIRQVKLDKLVWQTRLNSFTKSREVICYSQSLTSGPLKRSEEKSETPSISWLTSFYRLEFASFKNSGISHRYVYNSAKCSLAIYVKPLNKGFTLTIVYSFHTGCFIKIGRSSATQLSLSYDVIQCYCSLFSVWFLQVEHGWHHSYNPGMLETIWLHPLFRLSLYPLLMPLAK